MKRKLLFALGILAVVLGCNVSVRPGEFRALAQAGVCQFAGYGPAGQLINTTITCVTPSTNPLATSSPNATVPLVWSSTYPYNVRIASPFPSVTATACGQPAAISGYTVEVPVCAAQTTPSPSATSTSTAGAPSCVWSGSYPYTLGCNFPVAGGGATVVSPSPPIVVTTPAAGQYIVGCPQCLQGSSTIGWDAVALAETSATHVYPMKDAAGCNSVADAIAGGATAAPSPVPLPTPTTASTIICGAPSISNDGETSVFFPGTAASSYLVAPQSIWPASGNFSIEILSEGTVSMGGGNYSGNILYCVDSATALILGLGPGGIATSAAPSGDTLNINSTNVREFDATTAQSSIDRVVTWDGTNIRLYDNGALVETVADTPGFSASKGAIGTLLTGGPQQPWIGRIAKFAIYNTALTQAKILTHVAALGL